MTQPTKGENKLIIVDCILGTHCEGVDNHIARNGHTAAHHNAQNSVHKLIAHWR